MKSFLIVLVVAFVAATAVPSDAQARRFGGGGGGGGIGMQRSMPPRATPPQAAPARPAAAPTTAPAGAAAAAAPKRSWMGPIAGLAAGLGLAALMSHLGMGAEFANMIMLALLAVAAFVVIRLVMRRFAPAAQGNRAPQGMQFAGAGAGAGSDAGRSSGSGTGFAGAPSTAAEPAAWAAPAAATSQLPEGFDAASFERIAKMIFIRMQTANDAGDLDDLRHFTTPEVFAAARLELQERGAGAQRTDVVRVDAEVVEATTEADRQVVSVRFHGLIREEQGGVAEPFDEVWHLSKPVDGSREWAIAGIQPSTPLVTSH